MTTTTKTKTLQQFRTACLRKIAKELGCKPSEVPYSARTIIDRCYAAGDTNKATVWMCFTLDFIPE